MFEIILRFKQEIGLGIICIILFHLAFLMLNKVNISMIFLHFCTFVKINLLEGG